MGKYARGKHAVLIDDRSGFKIRYKDARTEWTGFRVYKGDWEPKQPQLEVRLNFADPQALYEPRPDKDVPAGDGLVRTTKVNAFNSLVVDPIGTALAFSAINGSVGTVTVVTT